MCTKVYTFTYKIRYNTLIKKIVSDSDRRGTKGHEVAAGPQSGYPGTLLGIVQAFHGRVQGLSSSPEDLSGGAGSEPSSGTMLVVGTSANPLAR